MKILQVCDVPNWAIGKLADTIKKKNQHLDIRIISISPKELRVATEVYTSVFENEVKQFNPDIIHFHYWDTANTLSQSSVCRGKKLILTHHNQKNLLTHKWEHIDCLVVHTNKSKTILEKENYWNIEVIQHGIDIEKFRFNEKYDPTNRKLGYVGRIVSWKGLYEILKTAKELETKVIMQGRIDKAGYWERCHEFKEQMDIRFGTPDNQQVNVYHEFGAYIGNSIDGIEEGTLGLLEAMACGIPVITTPSGEANDIITDGENGILFEFENRASLKEAIEKFFKMSPKEKNKMRENAWNTVRQMSQDVMARKYERLYYRLLYSKDLVSVIIPTHNRASTISNVLDAYSRQTYAPIEIVVADDNSTDDTLKVLSEWKNKNRRVPLKYLNTKYEGYGLAMARNMAIFEASGHYLVFNDDRFVPEPHTVEAFINRLKKIKVKSAVWGNKGAGKRDFIENFFAIRKRDISNAGMFNERINEYGGQSQEIRERLRGLNYVLEYEPLAIAEPQFGTHNRTNRRYELFRTKTKLWKLTN